MGDWDWGHEGLHGCWRLPSLAFGGSERHCFIFGVVFFWFLSINKVGYPKTLLFFKLYTGTNTYQDGQTERHRREYIYIKPAK